MIKSEFEYEISLVQSDKKNQCIKLYITSKFGKRSYFGRSAVNKCVSLSKIIGKEEVKRVKELKELTDKMYTENN